MRLNNMAIQSAGVLICIGGIAGIFLRVSSDDGALSISGAIIFASGVISQSVENST